MKVLILIIIASVTYSRGGVIENLKSKIPSLPTNELEKLKNKVKNCTTMYNIGPEKLKLIKKNEVEKLKNDNNAKCFLECLLKEVRVLKDGQVQSENMVKNLGKFVGEKKLNETITSCPYQKKKDCDEAFKLYECYLGRHSTISWLWTFV